MFMSIQVGIIRPEGADRRFSVPDGPQRMYQPSGMLSSWRIVRAPQFICAPRTARVFERISRGIKGRDFTAAWQARLLKLFHVSFL